MATASPGYPTFRLPHRFGNQVAGEYWVCGTNFNEPRPFVEGDPWKKLNELTEKFDNETCKGWTEEIGNLLTFTGLFGATVTAFVVESYQWLQEDPNETSALLLAQIVGQLANITNPSPGPPPLPPTQQDAIESYMIRVNILWFLSLMLTLSTVLAGILCMQWLREFQRDSSMIQRDNIPVRFLRFRGLQEWHVPQIISTLPVLLQLSVMSFFAGVIDLLWHLHPTVASIVTAVVGATIFFILFTTLAPTLHFFASYTFGRGHSPAPCPYKSPQAWAFFRTMQFLEGIAGSLDKFLHVNFCRYLFALLLLPLQLCVRSSSLTSSRSDILADVKRRFRQLFDHIGTTRRYRTWLGMDKYWHKEDSWHRTDSAGGISWIIQNYGHRIDVFAWIVHAVDTLDIEDLRVLSQERNPCHHRIYMSNVETGLTLILETELLTLGILLNMPLNWQDDRLGFRTFVHERIIRCINTDPELSSQLIPIALTTEIHHREFMPFLSKNATYRGRVHADSLLIFYATACRDDPGKLQEQVFYTLYALTSLQGGVWNVLRYMEVMTRFVTSSEEHSDLLLREIRPGWDWIQEWYLSTVLPSATADSVYTTRSEMIQLDRYFSQYAPEIRTPSWIDEVNSRVDRNVAVRQSRVQTPRGDVVGYSGRNGPELAVVLRPGNGVPPPLAPPSPVFVPPHNSEESSDSDDESSSESFDESSLSRDDPQIAIEDAVQEAPGNAHPPSPPPARPLRTVPLPPESPPIPALTELEHNTPPPIVVIIPSAPTHDVPGGPQWSRSVFVLPYPSSQGNIPSMRIQLNTTDLSPPVPAPPHLERTDGRVTIPVPLVDYPSHSSSGNLTASAPTTSPSLVPQSDLPGDGFGNANDIHWYNLGEAINDGAGVSAHGSHASKGSSSRKRPRRMSSGSIHPNRRLHDESGYRSA